MELTILGSGTAVPSPTRGSPGQLLRAAGRVLLLDCGPGSLRAAAAAGARPESIDGVVISHFHPDHHLDLLALLFVLRNPNVARAKPLVIVAPAGFGAVLDHSLAGPLGGWLRPEGYALDLREVGPGEHDVLGIRGTAIPVDHTPESLAWRFREGEGHPVLAWSGDTSVCDGVVRAGRGAELLLLECAVPDAAPFGKHLTPTRAGEIAARADPGRLVLTHFYPEVLEEPILEVVGRAWPGPAELAEDGAVYRI